MKLQTPCGEFELPDSFADEYKDKTDVELLEILLEQYKKFLDPVLVQILVDKGLLSEGMFAKEIERKIAELKGEKEVKNIIVNCYTCEHNGQDTCKGCNTILNGEDEPYENWQLREDLASKDQQIAELQSKVKELEEEIKTNKTANTSTLVKLFDDENKKLKHQLKEQPKQIVEEIMDFFKLLPTDEQVNEFLDNLLKKYEEKNNAEN